MNAQDIRQVWADRLLKARQDAGLTQQQLSARTGLDQAYISRIENARVTPGVAIQVTLAQALGVPHAELFAVEQAA